MSDFEKYIEARYPNRSPKIPFQKFKDIDGILFYGIKEVEDQAEAWNHQQAIIDNLKTQLNNMEACYIEKKKECDEQQAKIDELNQHIKRLESKLDSLGADRQELVGQVNDLQKQVDALKGLAQTFWEKSSEKHKQGKVWESKSLGECADEILDELEQALKGGNE